MVTCASSFTKAQPAHHSFTSLLQILADHPVTLLCETSSAHCIQLLMLTVHTNASPFARVFVQNLTHR